MPAAITAGLVITTAETIPLGELICQKLEDLKSSFAETQETGHMLVSVARPGAVETQRVVSNQSLPVIAVTRE
jgi:hypothetical protein